jgi:hypothetical protein
MTKPEVKKERPIIRENFGPGQLGEYCFSLIQQGVTCETIVGPNGQRCGKRAKGTTDFDVLGEATILVHCSEEHHQLIINAVQIELTTAGRSTVFGRNGFGRA